MQRSGTENRPSVGSRLLHLPRDQEETSPAWAAAEQEQTQPHRTERESAPDSLLRIQLTAAPRIHESSTPKRRASLPLWDRQQPRRAVIVGYRSWCDSAVPRVTVRTAASGYQRLPSPCRLLFSESYPFASEHRVASAISLERQGT